MYSTGHRLAQSREIDTLRKELEETKAKLEDREIRMEKAGNIAEASLLLTKVFEEAQKAADLYVENMKRRNKPVNSSDNRKGVNNE